MLLTSSQAAVLITSGIVLLCTSALFISGALIQQRTLRDLRTAIRPVTISRPKPRVWDSHQRLLGEEGEPRTRTRTRTKTTVIRLDDGTRVHVQEFVDDVVDDIESIDMPLPLKGGGDGKEEGNAAPDAESSDRKEGDDDEVIEVRLTQPTDPDDAAQKPIAVLPLEDEVEHNGGGENEGSAPDGTSPSSPLWDGVQDGGEILTRAERRRRIKAEIQRLSLDDKPVYYQRRLW